MAKAWVDRNGNGIEEADEAPLPGVTFVLLYEGRRFTPMSGPTGEAHFLLRIPCEHKAVLEIHAKPMEGYQLTTSQSIENIPVSILPEEPFLFGFVESNHDP